MVTILDWPSDIPPPMSASWFLQVSTKSPGPGLDGRRQVIYREMRYWTCKLQLTELWGQRLNTFEAFLDDCFGSAGLIRVPVVNSNVLRAPSDVASFLELIGASDTDPTIGVPFADATTFDDGLGWDIPSSSDPTFAADAPVGATVTTLVGFLGENLIVGGFFSVNGFLYRVAANTGGVVRFNPPLREAVTAGTTAKVNAPECVMRLSQDMQARLTREQRMRGTVPAFDLDEAFQR
jgi:hypothetical protein